jgi:hypothetical protein
MAKINRVAANLGYDHVRTAAEEAAEQGFGSSGRE